MRVNKTLVVLLLLPMLSVLLFNVAKAQSKSRVNIKDIFLLLPDEVLPLPLNGKQRKHLLEKKETDNLVILDVCDVRNAYLSMSYTEYNWEMCYWNLKDGRKLVVVNENTETGSIITVYFYENGKLRKNNSYILGGMKDFRPEDFMDIGLLEEEVAQQVRDKFQRGDYQLFYQLPRKGTTIEISLDSDRLVEDADLIPDGIRKKVAIKWVNERWVRQD